MNGIHPPSKRQPLDTLDLAAAFPPYKRSKLGPAEQQLQHCPFDALPTVQLDCGNALPNASVLERCLGKGPKVQR
jgi:hypothetical protein